MSQFVLLQMIPLPGTGMLPVHHCFASDRQQILESPAVGIVEYCGLYDSPEDAINAVLYEADQEKWSSDMGTFVVYNGDNKPEVVRS